MEGASHIVLKRTKGALKTVDAFDFLVEHLSIYERRLGLLHLPSKHQKLVAQQVIHVMRRREQALKVGWSLGGSASGEALDLYQHHGQGSSGSSGVSASSVASRAALQARVGVGGDVTKSSVSATLEADAAEEVTEKELAAAWQRVADGTAWGGETTRLCRFMRCPCFSSLVSLHCAHGRMLFALRVSNFYYIFAPLFLPFLPLPSFCIYIMVPTWRQGRGHHALLRQWRGHWPFHGANSLHLLERHLFLHLQGSAECWSVSAKSRRAIISRSKIIIRV